LDAITGAACVNEVPLIAYVRDTALLTDALIEAYVAAQQIQISRDFAPIWGLDAKCEFVKGGDVLPLDCWIVWFRDHAPVDGELGVHDDPNEPNGYVYVADCLRDGLNWNVTASHETLEMLADPQITRTVTVGPMEYCWEVCDACEDDKFAYPVGGHFLSDFVRPSWFDPDGKGPYTFRTSTPITYPFGLASGGYIGARKNGGPWQQIMARTSGSRQVKGPGSRTLRRFRAASGT
jgi:hypothetical protein